jgi:3-oxoadipate enol-lactonase
LGLPIRLSNPYINDSFEESRCSNMSFVKSHGVDIYYESHGTADRTIVLAHGMGGNAAIWFNQVAEFYKDYRVIAFDHRYFARSQCAADLFEPAKFSDDVISIMDALNIESATFICQSMGGWTGSQMAVHHSERVNALVMSHTPGIFYHPEVVNNQEISDLVRQIGTGFASPALAFDFPEKNPAGAVLYAQVSNFNGIDNAVIPRKIGEAGIGVDTKTLATYSVPTLFVTGELDVLFPAEYIEALAATVPGAECVNLGQVGHSSYFEKPEEFNAEVRRFLARHHL